MDYTQSIVNNEFNLQSEQTLIYSELFELLAQLYNQIPDRGLVKRLQKINFTELINSMEGIDENIHLAIKNIQKYISDTKHETEDAVQLALAREWTRLFRGVSPTYGPPPPYEAEYTNENIQVNQLLMKLNNTYLENDIEIQTDLHLRPDYIGVELDFVRVLLHSEANFLRKQNSEGAKQIRQTLCYFLNTHLKKWIKPFVKKASTEARTSFYLGLLQLTEAIVFDPILCNQNLGSKEIIE